MGIHHDSTEHSKRASFDDELEMIHEIANLDCFNHVENHNVQNVANSLPRWPGELPIIIFSVRGNNKRYYLLLITYYLLSYYGRENVESLCHYCLL